MSEGTIQVFCTCHLATDGRTGCLVHSQMKMQITPAPVEDSGRPKHRGDVVKLAKAIRRNPIFNDAVEILRQALLAEPAVEDSGRSAPEGWMEQLVELRQHVAAMGISWNNEQGREFDGEPLRLWDADGEPRSDHPWIQGQVLARKNAAAVVQAFIDKAVRAALLVPQEEQ